LFESPDTTMSAMMWKRGVLCFGLYLLLTNTCAWAQEGPELDLIRGLRKRGWHDLAMERLQQLQTRTQPPLPAEWKQLIPIEIAKTRVALASRVEDASERDRLLEATRKELAAFVKNPANAQNPLLGEAFLDLAKITAEQANAKAAEARHASENTPQRLADTKQAIALYTAADAAFKEAAKRLEEAHHRVENSRNLAERQGALELYLDSLFQHGLMLWQMSETYPKDDAKGGEALRTASKSFDTLAAFRDKPESGAAAVALGWQAYAWYGRTMMELELTKGQAAYQRVERERKPEAVGAQRLVRYFKLLASFPAGAPAAQRNPWLAEGERWLKDFAAAYNSAEGQHLRYLLGLLYLDELEEEKNPQRKSTPGYQALVTKATNHLSELERTSSRYGAVAMNLKLRVRSASGQAINSPILLLKTFEDCLLRADHEYREAVEASKKAASATDELEKSELTKKAVKHNQDLLEAIRRGIAMMPSETKDDQWEKAYALLYAGYLNADDYHRAVIALDHLARHTKKPEAARERVVLAMRLYQFLADKGDPYARQEMVSLASVLEQRWPNDSETEAARDLLGFDLLRQKKFREGAAMLAKVTEKYAKFPHCSYWAGRLYWNLHYQAMREAKKPVQTPSPDRDQALALLMRCIKAAEAVKNPAHDKIAVEAKAGLAEIYNQLAQVDEVLKLVGPLVTAVEQKKLPPDLEPGTETQILGLALRAQIQKKDTNNAIKVLDVLKAQGSQEDIGKGLTEHLVALGKQIRAEIDDLSMQGPTAADRLQQMKESFRQFLDHLEKDSKLTPEIRMWVATNYQGLGDHLKASEIYAKINEGAQQPNLAAQLLYHGALRQAAAAELNPAQKSQLLTRAEAELKKIMDANDKVKRHPAFVKEQIHLKQERGQLSGPNGAIVAWDKLRQALEPHIDRNAQFKQIYLDSTFYLVWCLHQEARQIQNLTVRKEAMERAAQRLKALQQVEDLKPRFDELLADPRNRDLKEAYDRIGRAAAK
jgi:hypothetical protein